MAEILVSEEGERFRVSLTDGASVTYHDVGAPAEQLASLGLGECDPAAVVEESFRFLLEKEPKESILPEFDLATIERYFAGYPEAIRRRMAGEAD